MPAPTPLSATEENSQSNESNRIDWRMRMVRLNATSANPVAIVNVQDGSHEVAAAMSLLPEEVHRPMRLLLEHRLARQSTERREFQEHRAAARRARLVPFSQRPHQSAFQIDLKRTKSELVRLNSFRAYVVPRGYKRGRVGNCERAA